MKNHTAAHLLNAAVKKVFPVSHFKNGFVDNEMISTTFAIYGYSYTAEGNFCLAILNFTADISDVSYD